MTKPDQVVNQAVNQSQTMAGQGADPSQSPPLDLLPQHLPNPPSYWPLAWGWYVLIGLILCVLILFWWQHKRSKQKNLAKNQALESLKNAQDSPQKMQEILRRACLSYFPRETIAKLHGKAWFEFLDQQYLGRTSFISLYDVWQAALYQDKTPDQAKLQELYGQTKTWLQKALPCKTIHSKIKHKANTNHGVKNV